MCLIILGTRDDPNSSLPLPLPTMSDWTVPSNGVAICNMIDRPSWRRVLVWIRREKFRYPSDRGSEG